MQEPDDSPRHFCYGCGGRNPEGLHIDFEVEGRRVAGTFTARDTHVGFPGVAHGGIAAAVLDEAMGWAMYASGAWAMTARMEVKYRRPLPLGTEVTVTGEVVRERGRVLDAVAQIRDGSGVLVEAKGMFVRLPREKQSEFQRFFLGNTEPVVPG
jgi:uncharacterized protein (TIGR00369 family)